MRNLRARSLEFASRTLRVFQPSTSTHVFFNMRSLLFAYTLIALTLASPVPDLEARGGYGGFPIFGGIGGSAISGDSGDANGGPVKNIATSPWGSVTNVWGSGEYFQLSRLHSCS